MKIFLYVIWLSIFIYSFTALSYTSCKGFDDRGTCMKVKACKKIFVRAVKNYSSKTSYECSPDTGNVFDSDRCPPGRKCHCTVLTSSFIAKC